MATTTVVVERCPEDVYLCATMRCHDALPCHLDTDKIRRCHAAQCQSCLPRVTITGQQTMVHDSDSSTDDATPRARASTDDECRRTSGEPHIALIQCVCYVPNIKRRASNRPSERECHGLSRWVSASVTSDRYASFYRPPHSISPREV